MFARLMPFAALAAIAACTVEPNPTITTASGAIEIQITDGLNCYDNQCFKYDARYNTVSVAGRVNTSPPPGTTLADGSVSPAEFKATFEKAVRARTVGGPER